MAKRNTTKEKEAKEKVANLLKDSGILTKEKPKEDKIKKTVDKKSTDWLQKQLDTLTKENEALLAEKEAATAEYKKLFNDYTALKNSSNAPVSDEALKAGVLKIFHELENNYLGRNPQRTKYTDVKIIKLLDKFVENFKFLQKK